MKTKHKINKGIVVVALISLSSVTSILACVNTSTSSGTCGTNTNTGPEDVPACTITTCPTDFQCGGQGSTQTDYYCALTPYQANCDTSVGTPDYVDVGPYGHAWICDSYAPGGSVAGGACHTPVEFTGCK